VLILLTLRHGSSHALTNTEVATQTFKRGLYKFKKGELGQKRGGVAALTAG
jgi:hypothetical protein